MINIKSYVSQQSLNSRIGLTVATTEADMLRTLRLANQVYL